MKSYLEDNYDLMCYNSKLSKDADEVKLLAIMGSNLMIVMFENNEIQKREINTSRKLNIPILFIYDSEDDKQRHSGNERKCKIVFKNLEDVEIKLKNKFKLIKKLKKRKDLPFKTLEYKTELFEFIKIESISILKEKNQLILTGNKIQSYDLHKNTQKAIQTLQFNEGQLNACVNNKDEEIIVLNNNVFSTYNFDFVKTSEDKILRVKDVINEIVVNEENKHVYGISNSSHKLFHFDEKFKIIEEKKDIKTPLLIRVLNNNLYILLEGYGNLIIEGTNLSHIIENEKSFIGVYSQERNELIKFKRKIFLDFIVAPRGFHVDENYIFIFSRYINKDHLFQRKSHVLVFNHDGIFLQKTGLDISGVPNTKFLVFDYQTIYCADFKNDSTPKFFKKLEFSN
jgi:hypothetical protein